MAFFQEGCYQYCTTADENVEESIFGTLTRSIGAYRHLLAGGPSLGALEMCKGDDELVGIISGSPDTCLKKLKNHIDCVYKASPFREPDPTLSAASIGALPAERTHLSHLFAADGSCLQEANDVAANLKEYWEAIWTKPDAAQTDIDYYLADYNKHLHHFPGCISLHAFGAGAEDNYYTAKKLYWP